MLKAEKARRYNNRTRTYSSFLCRIVPVISDGESAIEKLPKSIVTQGLDIYNHLSSDL